MTMAERYENLVAGEWVAARGGESLRDLGGFGRWPIGDYLPDERDGVFTFTVREPLGVVIAIAPRNDPALTPARKMAPALIAGDTVADRRVGRTHAVRRIQRLRLGVQGARHRGLQFYARVKSVAMRVAGG